MRNLLCGLPPLYPGCIRPHLGKKVVRQTTYSFLLSFAVEFDTGQAIMMIDRGDISLNINLVPAFVPSTLNKKGLIEIWRNTMALLRRRSVCFATSYVPVTNNRSPGVSPRMKNAWCGIRSREWVTSASRSSSRILSSSSRFDLTLQASPAARFSEIWLVKGRLFLIGRIMREVTINRRKSGKLHWKALWRGVALYIWTRRMDDSLWRSIWQKITLIILDYISTS